MNVNLLENINKGIERRLTQISLMIADKIIQL